MSGEAGIHLIAPESELDPKVVPWGPFNTSIRSISNNLISIERPPIRGQHIACDDDFIEIQAHGPGAG